MAPNERRFERWSNVVMFAVPAVVAIAVAAVTAESSRDFQSTNRDVGVAEPVPVPPRCLEIDRAIVVQLTALLERNGPADAPILERASTHSTLPADIACTGGIIGRQRTTSG